MDSFSDPYSESIANFGLEGRFDATYGGSGYSSKTVEALHELEDHLVIEDTHEETIAPFLEDNPDIAEHPGLLVAAGAVPLHEMKQVQYQEFRVYKLGDTVVVEERGEEGWEPSVSVPYDVAHVVAQARAENRSRALRMDHDDLREEVEDEIEEMMKNTRPNGAGITNRDYFNGGTLTTDSWRSMAMDYSVGGTTRLRITDENGDEKIVENVSISSGDG